MSKTSMSDPWLGIQLYSVRDPLQADFRGTLEALSAMGFHGVEFASYDGGMEPGALAALLKDLRLGVCGNYVGFSQLADPGDPVYSYARALGCGYLTSGFSPEDLRGDFDGCVALAQKACTVAGRMGVTVCYHAHAYEFETVNGERFLDRLLAGVPVLAFEPDTAWIHRGGEDVIGYMQRYATRIPLIHVKDIKANGDFTELGSGIIDLAAVAAFAREHRIQWLIYEQDTSELTPLESARISLERLRQL